MIFKSLTSRGPDTDRRGATIEDVSLQAKYIVSEGIIGGRKNNVLIREGVKKKTNERSQRSKIYSRLRDITLTLGNIM